MADSENVILRQEVIRLHKRVGELENTVTSLSADNNLLRREVRQKDAKNASLAAALKAYENPHTPPSKARPKKTQRQVQEKDINGNIKSGGRKKGHPGSSTRRKADRTEPHEAEECTNCGSNQITRIGSKSKIVTDIMLLLEHVNHVIGRYHCEKCQKNFDADNNIVAGTDLGPNLLAFIYALVSNRATLRGAARIVNDLTSLSLCHRTIENAMECMALKAEPVCKQIQKDVKKAPFAYADETKVSVSGLISWIWAVVTATEVFYLVHWSRAGTVFDMMVKSSMTIICDGYSVYQCYDIQRCWAHILREAKDEFKSDPDLEAPYRLLQDLFVHARDVEDADDLAILSMVRQVEAIADMYEKCGSPFAVTLRNAAPDLFTFLKHEGMEPTNNTAERALRKPVVHRKIMGKLNNAKGMKRFGNMMTFTETMRRRGLNPVAEMKKLLTEPVTGLS